MTWIAAFYFGQGQGEETRIVAVPSAIAPHPHAITVTAESQPPPTLSPLTSDPIATVQIIRPESHPNVHQPQI